MRHTRHMHAPTPIPDDVTLAVRIRAARAQFAAAIAGAMLANVAGGMSPPWHRGAPLDAVLRWNAFEHLSGLLHYGGDQLTTVPSSELRELLNDARPHVPTTVYLAGLTLADTADACNR